LSEKGCRGQEAATGSVVTVLVCREEVGADYGRGSYYEGKQKVKADELMNHIKLAG